MAINQREDKKLTREGPKQRKPKSGMMAKPMMTSQSTKGKNAEAPIDNEVVWVAVSPKGNDIAVEE